MVTPPRAVLYARVSTEDQARKGYSLQSQTEICRQYAAGQGWLVVADITDDGVSGATLDRPGLDQVRSMAANREYERLIVLDLDRLARRLAYQQVVELELEKAGVHVVYVNGGYAESHEGSLQKNLRAAIAEYERAQIADRNSRGRRTKARNGKVVGAGVITYGYEYTDGEYTINDTEAAVVRLIYRLYREGASIRGIAKVLSAQGFITRTGSRTWSPGTVSDMLRNETYSGVLYYGKRKPNGDGTLEYRDKDLWIAIDVPPIIDRAEWDLVQAQMDRNRDRIRRRPTHQYLLRGILRCPICDRAYGGAASGETRSYRDGGRKHRQLRADDTERLVWTAITQILNDHESLLEGWQAGGEDCAKEREATQAELGQTEQQGRKAMAKLDRLTTSYIDPDIPMGKDEYNRLRADIQREVDGAIERAEKLRQRLEADEVTEAHRRSLEEFAAAVKDKLASADFDAKRQILRELQVTGDVRWTGEDRHEILLQGLFPPIAVGLSPGTSESARHLFGPAPRCRGAAEGPRHRSGGTPGRWASPRYGACRRRTCGAAPV